jgi:nitric oxide dioxygenase
MTPLQVSEVQASFSKLVLIADPSAALFYDRLFAMAPEIRALFGGDMERQGRKLMSALATVVNSLDDFDAIVPIACDLAKRHVAYGVVPEHYALVGSALLWTLEQGLGDEFSPTLRAAWEAAYSALSEVMIASAYPMWQQASPANPIDTARHAAGYVSATIAKLDGGGSPDPAVTTASSQQRRRAAIGR